MDLYSFVVENFVIHDTRALHNDTLSLSYAAYLDGDQVAFHLQYQMDDFDNGEWDPNSYTGGGGLKDIVMNDPMAKTAFMFQLANTGNPPAGTVSGRMAASFDQLAGITAGLAGAAAAEGSTAVDVLATIETWPFLVGLLMEAFANLYSWLSADCDGPVAVDQLSAPRYVLDNWLDADPTQTITFTRSYPGTDSPTGCGGNSNYEVTWSLQRKRSWTAVTDPTGTDFVSSGAVSATTHNGAVHAFGIGPGGAINHARTFTGACWRVDVLPQVDVGNLPVSTVSFNDRLWVMGVRTDGSVSSLAYTVDGSAWVPRASSPAGLLTAEPAAAAVFGNRLYAVARDSATGSLRVTSSADLETWNPWTDVPSAGLSPTSPVSAAVLAERLYLFGIYETGKRPAAEVVCNSTGDGSTWTGWQLVEGGARPEDYPTTEPLDVAATVFRDRIYLATRWLSTVGETTYYMAVNFSGDGENWSGWRLPKDDTNSQYQSNATAGLAAVNNHLYILAPQFVNVSFDNTKVWAY